MAKAKVKRKRRRKKTSGFGWLLIALAFAGFGESVLHQQMNGAMIAFGWLLMALGGAALVLQSRKTDHRALTWEGGREVPAWLEASMLVLLFAGALFLRVYNIESYPNAGFRDEGENGNVAIQMMNNEVVRGTDSKNPAYIEMNTQNAAGYFYPTAVSFKLFGVSITSVRYVSIFFGALSIIAFYALARMFFGAPLGFFLALGLCLLRWHINFSRIGFLGIMTLFLEIPVFYFLYRGLREKAGKELAKLPSLGLGVALFLVLARGVLGFYPGLRAYELWIGLVMSIPMIYYAWKSAGDPRTRNLMLASIALALSMYSYMAARLLVVVVLAVVFHFILTRKGLIKQGARRALWIVSGMGLLGLVLLIRGSAIDIEGPEVSSTSRLVMGLGQFLLLLGALGFGWITGTMSARKPARGILFAGLAMGLAAFLAAKSGLGGEITWKAIAAISGSAMLAGVFLNRAVFTGWLRPIAISMGISLVVAGPLFSYTLAHTKEVNARSYRVSVYNDEEYDKRPWGAKLTENIPKTIGMYNVRGDGNPRHNLPGEIMFNPGWAALLGLGLFLALLRLRDPRHFMVLCWWQVSLMGGYLSIEAPQAYRTMIAIPALMLAMGFTLERVIVALRRKLGRNYQLLALPLLLALFILGGIFEVHTYFTRQPKHPGVWAEFSAGEYLMGKELRQRQPNTHGFARADWADSYTFRFMTWPERDYERFILANHVPIRDAAAHRGKNFLYLLGKANQPLLPILRSFYPSGEYNEERHPATDTLLYWSYFVPASDVAASANIKSGLKAIYYEDMPPTSKEFDAKEHWMAGHVKIERVDPFLLFNWTVSPVPGFFSAEWTGKIKIDKAGKYQFHTFSNNYATIEIDGKTVSKRVSFPEGMRWADGGVTLSKGKHRIRIRYYETRNYSRLETWWTPPGAEKQVIPSSVLIPE